jgi:hypothetical protein
MKSDTLGQCTIPERFKIKEGVDAAGAAESKAQRTRKTSVYNILVVLQAISAGLGYAVVEKNSALAGTGFMSKDTFARIQFQIGMAVDELCDQKCSEYRKYLKDNGIQFVWVSDMGWSVRGFTSPGGCYPVVNGLDPQHRHLACIVCCRERYGSADGCAFTIYLCIASTYFIPLVRRVTGGA